MFSIDISEYNGSINWAITAPVTELAIAKAVGTYGTNSQNNIDPMFNRNWAALGGYPNILRGAYLFLYMNDDPATAAKQFLDVVRPGPADLVALDLEDQATNTAKANKGTGGLWPIVKKSLDVLEAGIGKKPFIYTSAGWWNYYMSKVVAGKSITPPNWTADYPLWVAHYTLADAPLIPAGWKEWLIWQYVSDKVPGCGVSVGSNPNTDLNRLSITVDNLRARWNPAPVVPPVTPPPVGLTLESLDARLKIVEAKIGL